MGTDPTIHCNGVTPKGDIGAVTSTSGLAFKIAGRAGDSPTLGAGLYVDDTAGAAGGTGVGEEIIRIGGSLTIVEAMRGGKTPQEACVFAVRRVNAAAANTLLRTKLTEATAHYRDSKNLVFYFGEGAGGSRAPQDGFDVPHDAIAGGAVLGYGTVAGGPIPQAYTNGTLTYMWDNHTNRAAHSGLNEDALKAIAAQLGVPYFHRDNSPITPVVPALDVTSDQSQGSPLVSSHTVERTELYWVFTGLATALALAEIAFTLREFRLTAYQHRPARR